MPVNRQQPYQVVPQLGLTAVAYSESSTSALARQFQALLNQAGQATVSVLGQMEEQAALANRDLAAMAKLSAATQTLNDKKDLFTVEAATEAAQQATAQVNEDMQTAKMKLQEILDQKERGIKATVENSSPAQLAAMVNNGDAQSLDPKGYLKFEEQVGRRLATVDTEAALKSIHADPNKSLEMVFGELLAARPLRSDVAKASYLRTITDDVARFRSGQIIELIEQERGKNIENLFIRFQRDITFDAQDRSITAEKIANRIGQFQTDYRAANPRTVSELDVFEKTTQAIKGVLDSKALAKLSPDQLLPLASGLAELTKKDPLYTPLFAAVVNDISGQLERVEGKRAEIIKQNIQASNSLTDLLTSNATIQLATAKGEIGADAAASLGSDLRKRADGLTLTVNADRKVFQMKGSETSPLPDTAEQDKEVDASVLRYIAANPMKGADGNLRQWTLPELASFTYQRTGRLTRGVIDRLNSSVALPVGEKASPEAIQGWADATATVKEMLTTAPLYTRDLIRHNKIDARLALLANLHGDVPGFSLTGTATRLAKMEESNILEAQAILSGNKSFVRRNSAQGATEALPGGTKAVDSAITSVADVDSIVKDVMEGSAWWPTWRADYGSRRAGETFNALYTYYYAQQRQSGKTISEANDVATTNAKKEIGGLYQTFDLGQGQERYVVAPDFPVIAGQAQHVAEQAMYDFGAFWRREQRQAFWALVNEGKTAKNLIFRDTFSQLSLNLDDWRVEGSGVDAELVVPIRLDGVDLESTNPAFKAAIRFPLDPVKQKAAVQAARRDNYLSEPNIPMDVPMFGERDD